MRTLVRFTPDMDKGNQAIIQGVLPQLIEDTIEQLKPEAAFFFTNDGKRSAFFVFDLKNQSDIPVIAEPWFQKLNATVEFAPCMNIDDLRIGISNAAAQYREPAGV